MNLVYDQRQQRILEVAASLASTLTAAYHFSPLELCAHLAAHSTLFESVSLTEAELRLCRNAIRAFRRSQR